MPDADTSGLKRPETAAREIADAIAAALPSSVSEDDSVSARESA